MDKSNWKKEFYIIIVIVSIVLAIDLFFNITSNIKKFNQTTLHTFEVLHHKHLENLNSINNSNNENYKHLLPFELEYKENTIILKNKDKGLVNKDRMTDMFVNYFKIYEPFYNITTNLTHYQIVAQKLELYRYINIYLLTDNNELDNQIFIDKISREFSKYRESNPSLKFHLKFIYCNYNDIHSEDFYNNIQELNSKLLFEELQDEKVLSLIMLNQNHQNENKLEFNEIVELNKNIFTFNILKELNQNLIKFMLLISKAENVKNINYNNNNNYEFYEFYIKNVSTFV